MRLRAAWAIPWLLAVFLSALSTQGSTAQEDNLLTNGGFEDGTAGWSAIHGQLTASPAFARSGSYAGVFVADTPEQEVDTRVRHCLPVASGADYRFGGYAARGEAESLTVHLRISWYGTADCSGQQMGGSADQAGVVLDETEHWYEVALTASSLSSARSAFLTIVVENSDVTAYLDDFSVSGPAPSSQTPTPVASPYASPSPTHTAGPHGTPQPPATPRPRTPSPSATPRVTPTASSWEGTPVPAGSGLRNGGFEDVDSEGLPSFWRKWGGTLARTSAARFEGRFAAAFRSETDTTKWAYQIVSVKGGQAYVLSASALKDDPAVTAAYLRVSWYASLDGSGQAIDIVDSTERLADDRPEFRFLTTGATVAPAEAASAKVRLMLDPAGEAPAVIYLDDVTFEETAPPTPTVAPTATPPADDDGEGLAPSSPSLRETAPTSISEPGNVSTSAGNAAGPRSPRGSPTPAALGATRVPLATAAIAAPTPTRPAAAVYRQRKPDPPVANGAAVHDEIAGDGLSPSLLALVAGLPALAGAGGAICYSRWRRARLR